MTIGKIKLGNKKIMPFTIPSGIVTAEVSCLERMARKIPELGILTTKSIGPEPREGNREPILAQYAPGCFINAVGLTNPGAEKFAEQLSKVNFPKDKFLLASIFGKNAEEFVYVAKTLESYVDGFELNLSCPHAKEVGMALGQDALLVNQITNAVVSKTKKPVFAKLTPNVGNIGKIAKAAMLGGAYGIVAINTVGPGYHGVDGKAVLTNEIGGLSGIGTLPIGLKCVREVRQAVGEKPFIIGMAGIRTAKDVLEYLSDGANAVGIGSGLAGMAESEIKEYFPVLVHDLNNKTNNAEKLIKKVDMEYRKVRITEKINAGCDFKIFKTNGKTNCRAGQFVFAWIPGMGEKPFSIMDDNPLTLGILERGEFTKKINSLDKGDEFYVRGPYGKGVENMVPIGGEVVLVGGGCGIAGLYLLAKKLSETNKVISLLATKDKEHILYINEFLKYGKVEVTTEDGSLGGKGLVTDLFRDFDLIGSYFFNCGPKKMVEAVLPLELKASKPERIFSSVDYMTRCGVGICGSCADEKGRRTCVEGTFMNMNYE